MLKFKIILLLAIASQQVIASAIKGAPEAPTKGGHESLAAAAAPPAPVKGRQALAYERQRVLNDDDEQQQQQAVKGEHRVEQSFVQQQRVEHVEEQQQQQVLHQSSAARKESQQQQTQQLERAQEKTSARAEEKLSQQKLVSEEQQQEEIKQQPIRYDARPQVKGSAPKAPVYEQVKLEEQAPVKLEQQQLKLEQQPLKFEQQQQLFESQLVQQEEQRRTESSEVSQQQQQQLDEQGIKASGAEAEPYSFSYAVDGSSRSESGDTKGVVRGQYTLQGADGQQRIVDYVADHNGFRASINTNEFGTEARSPASVALRSSQPSAEDITLRLEGKTRESELLAAGTKGAPLIQAPAKGYQPQQLVSQQEPEQAPVKSLAASLRRPLIVQEEEAPRKESDRLEEGGQKSAEQQRTPKSIKQSRAGFESATAHRSYAQAAPVLTHLNQQRPYKARGPVVVRVAPGQQQPIRYLGAPAYPPSPVAYRRYPETVGAPVRPVEQRKPRVSFYASSSSSTDESNEQPSGFEVSPDSSS